VHLVGFITRIYHDARSPELQTILRVFILALVSRHAKRMRHIDISCGLPRSQMFPHYLINGTIFGEKINIHTVSVFIPRLPRTFLTSRIQRDNITTLHSKVPVFLARL